MTIEIDTSRISYWVRALSNLQKGDFREELRRAGKLLASDIINITPPTAQAGGGTQAQTRKIGENAVERDIRKIFLERQSVAFAGQGKDKRQGRNIKRLQELWRRGEYELLKAILPKTHWIHKLEFIDAPRAELHAKFRDRRGRVSAGFITNSHSRTRYVVTDKGALKAYIKKKQAMVGFMRGGWARSLSEFGGSPNAWVARHAHAGSFAEISTQSEVRFSLINRSGTMAGAERDMRILQNAVAHREKMMAKNFEALAAYWARKALRRSA